MTKDKRVADAVAEAETYLEGLDIQYSPITYVKSEERKPTLYEIVASWSLLLLKMVRSLKTSYLKSFPANGADVVVLFVDKDRALEDGSLYGQATPVEGVTYIEVYVSSKYAVTRDGQEFYTSNKLNAIRTQAAHTFIHELMHAYSNFIKTADILHVFITEGQFDSYKHYLLVNGKKINELAQRLFTTAKNFLGRDVTPKDGVPDSVACAETVNAIYEEAFGEQIGGGASTYNLYYALKKHFNFEQVETPQPGDIVISPTGIPVMPGGKLTNGHVGIVGEAGVIMSNDSATGLFKENYTLQTWKERYVDKGKYLMCFFRRKGI